jgi:sRNA-binding regulator protein Hfq
MPLKYVMLKLDSGELLPLLFPEFMQHSTMAQSVPATVVSAGRVYSGGREDRCLVGASSSLEVSSRDGDSADHPGLFRWGECHPAGALTLHERSRYGLYPLLPLTAIICSGAVAFQQEQEMAAAKHFNPPGHLLTHLRDHRTEVTMFLVSGSDSRGRSNRLTNSWSACARYGTQVVYKHAISAINPAEPVELTLPIDVR